MMRGGGSGGEQKLKIKAFLALFPMYWHDLKFLKNFIYFIPFKRFMLSNFEQSSRLKKKKNNSAQINNLSNPLQLKISNVQKN